MPNGFATNGGDRTREESHKIPLILLNADRFVGD